MSQAVKATEFRDQWVKVKVTVLTMKQTVSEIQTSYVVQGTLPAVGSEKSGKEQLSTTLL